MRCFCYPPTSIYSPPARRCRCDQSRSTVSYCADYCTSLRYSLIPKCPNLNRIRCSDQQLHRGDVDPRFGTRNRRLEIPCQAAVSIEPSEGPFDDPSTRQQLEARRVSRAFDDLDGPVAELGKGVPQIGAVIDAIGEEVARPRKQLVDRLDDQNSTIAILDIGSVDPSPNQQAAGIGHYMALAPLDLHGRIVTPRPTAFGCLDRLTVDHSADTPKQRELCL
jgi:hypothetical protein